MSRAFMREVIDALLPKGSAWEPASGGAFDKLLDGVSRNQQNILDDMGSLRDIRNPYNCPAGMLPDLEKEFGVAVYVKKQDEERRTSLAAVRYRKPSLPVAEKLQKLLDKAGLGKGGYGLVVTLNSPPVDPDSLLHAKAYYLYSASIIILKPIFPQPWGICCRESAAYGEEKFDLRSGKECMGYHSSYTITTTVDAVDTPPRPYWPLLFFVGGEAERDNEGRITSIKEIAIPETRKKELHRLILRVKPMGTWAAVNVLWV